MSLTIINADLTRRLLPMADCIDVLEPAMIAASDGSVSAPPRLASPLADGSGTMLLMPGSSAALGTYGAKVIGLHPDNPPRGMPSIQGFVTLFDYASGAPLALVEGATVTAVRTAAASGLATRQLAREDASSCGIFGTGTQAATHIEAMCAVRPIDRILLWGRDPARARALAAEQAKLRGLNVQASEDPAEVGACDLVCTVTGSPTPILRGDWVRSGAHVNLVGSHSLTTREADTALLAKSEVFVDLLESACNEGGDVMIPLQAGELSENPIRGEIGRVLSGELAGRGSAAQITLYKSLGIVAQDLFAANHVYHRALELGLGVTIDF